MSAPHTPGILVPCSGNARELYNLETSGTGNDLLPIATLRGPDRQANASRLALCWNTLAGLDNATVQRLGDWLGRYNADELRDMLNEEGV